MQTAEQVRQIMEKVLQEENERKCKKRENIREGVIQGVNAFLETFWEKNLIPAAKKQERDISLYFRSLFDSVKNTLKNHFNIDIEEDSEMCEICKNEVDRIFTEAVDELGFRLGTYETYCLANKVYDISW